MNKKLIRTIIAILAIVVGVMGYMIYDTSQKSINNKSDISKDTNTILKPDVSDWKTHIIPELGIQFKYPAYFGKVIVQSTDKTSCPTMKTYQPVEYLPSADYLVSFSNKPYIGTGGSYIETGIRIARTENDTDYCGLEISNLADRMGSDSDYQKINSGRKNLRSEYVSNLYSPIGTSVLQFYSLFFINRNQLILVQPHIVFLPSSGSNELKEIEANDDILGYVKNSNNAESIRSYLRDFEALSASIEVVD